MGLSTVHCHRSIETLTAAMTPEMKPEPLRPRMKRTNWNSSMSRMRQPRKMVKKVARTYQPG